MGKRKMTTIRVDEELLKKAHELGLNVSRIAENALREIIRKIEGPESSEKPRNCSNNPQNFVNGSPGEIRTPVSGSKARYACPLHHRASILDTCCYSRVNFLKLRLNLYF